MLRKDAETEAKLLILFLSDGEPSDHSERACLHGVQVWQNDGSGAVMAPLKEGGRQRQALRKCATHTLCRRQLRNAVHLECLRRIAQLGDDYGRDRLCIHTVAFGSPNEDFEVLKTMGA